MPACCCATLEDAGSTSSAAPTCAILALPHSIQEVVRRRLDALPQDVQHLLQLAALLGRELDPDVLYGAIVGETSASTSDRRARQPARRSSVGVRSSRRRRRGGSASRTTGCARAPTPPSLSSGARICTSTSGQVLETWHTLEGTLDRVYGQLAHHFERGRELVKALLYSRIAPASRLHRTHATREALFHLERAKQIEREARRAALPRRGRAPRTEMLRPELDGSGQRSTARSST